MPSDPLGGDTSQRRSYLELNCWRFSQGSLRYGSFQTCLKPTKFLALARVWVADIYFMSFNLGIPDVVSLSFSFSNCLSVTIYSHEWDIWMEALNAQYSYKLCM